MQTVLLTLLGPERRIDLKLPAEIPIADLLPKLLELCAPRASHALPRDLSRWQMQDVTSGAILDMTQSLAELALADGAILSLRQGTRTGHGLSAQQSVSRPFRPRAIRPSSRTGGIGVRWHLPEHMQHGERG